MEITRRDLIQFGSITPQIGALASVAAQNVKAT